MLKELCPTGGCFTNLTGWILVQVFGLLWNERRWNKIYMTINKDAKLAQLHCLIPGLFTYQQIFTPSYHIAKLTIVQVWKKHIRFLPGSQRWYDHLNDKLKDVQVFFSLLYLFLLWFFFLYVSLTVFGCTWKQDTWPSGTFIVIWTSQHFLEIGFIKTFKIGQSTLCFELMYKRLVLRTKKQPIVCLACYPCVQYWGCL